MAAAGILTAFNNLVRGAMGIAVGVCFFCLALRDGRRVIFQIDEVGYIDRMSLLAPGRVPWSRVRRLSVVTFSGQRLLTIEPSESPGTDLSWRARMGRRYRPPVLEVETLGIHLDELIRVARRHNPGIQVDGLSTTERGEDIEQGYPRP
jgi:hypothetical protein